MVTGKIPAEATEREKFDELASPEKIVSGISKGFSTAIMKALATESADRFQSIWEFQDALDRTGEPPQPDLEPEQKYIHVNCPNCKTKNTVPEGTSLKEVKCKSCGRSFKAGSRRVYRRSQGSNPDGTGSQDISHEPA